MSFQGQAQTASYAVEVLSAADQVLKSLRSLTDWANDIYFAYAWVSSAGEKAEHWKALDLAKVRQAVVGMHFNQTEPRALEILHREAPTALRVVSDTSGVFHPKIIVGVRGKLARAIVGSSNFTKGGFQSNAELNLALEGPVDAAPIRDLLDFVDQQWSGKRTFVPTEEWLSTYEKDYRNRPRPRHVQPPLGAMRTPVKWADLDVPWPRYFSLIAAQDRRQLNDDFQIVLFGEDGNSYLEEMEFCQDVFGRYAHFKKIPTAKRKHVAGFGQSTGFFGTMRPAGNFKSLVNEDPGALSELDRLPRKGDVDFDLAVSVAEALLKVDGVGLGVATRLLSMKRPDYFMPINSANRAGVRELYGKTPSTVRSYVEMLESLWAMEWWKAPEPKDPLESRVWHGRVALLDSVVYGWS